MIASKILNMKKLLITLTLLFITNLISAQCISGNCENDYGKFQYTDGVYEGYWKNSKKNGLGILVYTNGNYYFGEFQDDNFQGYGTIYLKNGENYAGQWANGKMHGLGIVKSNTQNNAGIWKEGKMTSIESTEVSSNKPTNCVAGNCTKGYGRITEGKETIEAIFREGKAVFGAIGNQYWLYMGQIVNNQPNGYGQIKYTDGNHYFGYFKNGQKNGLGILTKPDGTREHGTWENDVLQTAKPLNFCDELLKIASLTLTERQQLIIEKGIVLKQKFLGEYNMTYKPPTGSNLYGEISISYTNLKDDLGIGTATFEKLMLEMEYCDDLEFFFEGVTDRDYNHINAIVKLVSTPFYQSIRIRYKK